ncbi:MAG: aldo/keto reductase [Planctomycetota bacterium]
MLHRRDFLAALGVGITGLGTGVWPAWAEPAVAGEDDAGRVLPTRPFGRAGEPVTAACLGGWHVSRWFDDAGAARIIEASIEQGVRFFDTAEQYGQGESELRYGRHLVPRHRDRVFLMTKTQARSAEQARVHLDESLQRLATDRVDLWQVHAIESPQDVDARVDAGVVDVLLEAKAAGKARYIGYTGHSSFRAHLRMLERLEGLGVEMDAVQMPVNVLDPSYESFITHVLPPAVQRGYAVLGMKALANGRFTDKGGVGRDAPIVPDAVSVDDALRYAWSLPIASLVIGVDDTAQLTENCAVARQQRVMPEAERDALVARLAQYAGRQREYYKSGV